VRMKNDNNMYEFDILDLNDSLEIITNGKKTIYNVDNSKSLSEWVRKEIKEYNGTKMTLPHLTSALNVVEKETAKEISENYLGSFIGLGNNVQRNDRGVTILTSTGVQGNAKVSLSITNNNFNKMTIALTVRKLIRPDWINEKDEYFAPRTI
jgi:hypothetical protein